MTVMLRARPRADIRLEPLSVQINPRGNPRATAHPNHPLPDDGIMDMLAVEIAASGNRHVQLTRRERIAAAALMHARGWGGAVIAERLGVSRRTVSRLLSDSGDERAHEAARNLEW